MKRILSVFLAMMMLLCACSCSFAEDAAEGEYITFTSTDKDGNPIDDSIFADYAITMINCWEPWCGPCKAEMPDLETIYQEYKDEGFLLLGVHAYDDGLQDALDATGVTYPIVSSTDAFDAIVELTQAVPTTFFVDSNGRIIDDEDLLVEMNLLTLQQTLDAYLAGELDEYKAMEQYADYFAFLDAAAEDPELMLEAAKEQAATDDGMPGLVLVGSMSYETWQGIVELLLDWAEEA